MKISSFVIFGAALAVTAGTLLAQEPAPPSNPDPDRVVVAINGQDYTAGDLDMLRRNLPDVFRRQTANMSNKVFVETLGYLLTAAGRAEEDKLMEQEPWKTQLWFNQLNFMANAHLAGINSTLEITEESKQKFYEDHKSDYEEARVSAIYLDYTPIPELAEKQGKKVVTEREAWEKAEKLLVELRNGAEFAELAKENSDDAGSAAKGGDLGYFSPDDASLSQPVKEAIFALAEGQVSAPVKDAGRYYVFKVTERRARPYSDVAVAVLQRLQSTLMQEKLEELRKAVEIEYKDPEWVQ
jgi:hypothetical protein